MAISALGGADPVDSMVCPGDIVRLCGVEKGYLTPAGDRRPILCGINASIARGHWITLLGKSGSGKSTLLNVLSGMDLVDSGQIHLFGSEISALDERQRTMLRRRSIGFVFQSFNLIPTLTLEENLILPLRLKGLPENTQKIRELLQEIELDLDPRLFPEQLSGGEQQRLAVARALIHEPDLLIADEPTGNLDEDTANKTLQLMHRMVCKRGLTLLVATHSANVLPYSDFIWRLRRGTLESVEKDAL